MKSQHFTMQVRQIIDECMLQQMIPIIIYKSKYKKVGILPIPIV